MDFSTLQQTLRRLQFDERIDANVIKMILLDAGPFTVSFPLDPEHAAGMEFNLHFSRQGQRDYALSGYDAFLFRTMNISDITIKGIGMGELLDSLDSIDWEIPPGERSPEQQDFFNDTIKKIFVLSNTPEGNKIAALLINRYSPDFPGLELDPRLKYHEERKQYYVSYNAKAGDVLALPAPQGHAFLVSQMDEAMPHLYQVEITVMDLANSENVIRLRSTQQFPEIDAAGELFNQLTPGFFDKESVRGMGYPWVIMHAHIQDSVDDTWVVSKSVSFETDAMTGKKGISITLEINDQKVDPISFIRRAGERFPILPEDIMAVTDIKQRFVPIDPIDNPSKHQAQQPPGKRIKDFRRSGGRQQS